MFKNRFTAEELARVVQIARVGVEFSAEDTIGWIRDKDLVDKLELALMSEFEEQTIVRKVTGRVIGIFGVLICGLILLVMPRLGYSQTEPVAPVVDKSPQFMLSGAGGFDQYSTPKFSGEVNGAVRLTGNTYSLTGYSMLAKSSTATTGIMQQVYQSGRVSLYVIGTAGSAMGDTTAQFTGMAGGIATYHGFLSRVPGLFVYGKVAGAYSTLVGAHPIFFLGLGWRSQ